MIEFWHNPRCSKSRQALTLLQARGIEIRERRYLEEAPSLEELASVRAALGQPPAVDMMRVGEKLFRELGLSKTDDDATLMQAMADHPILIERPLAISGRRAVIGRPPERVLELL
ncbi:arsenate reductase (glutaredoxin) [Sedimentitalea nanhaiensis]|uniref:Arsenate reductase n=1 Tax=Sedimentitalea nanhaiensis TaxID=999627 RepID=A0A1I7B255_9RHOB|nr:arsenate reductase (glutaredoxin) [Sedimentitalea nanhaiensis]SFT81290.1 arsenate reductase [Sedimentitalea nanhaiensis]